MPRNVPAAGRHLRVTVTLPLSGSVFEEAAAINATAAPIAALREALGDGATVETVIETARRPRKAKVAAVPAPRQHAA